MSNCLFLSLISEKYHFPCMIKRQYQCYHMEWFLMSFHVSREEIICYLFISILDLKIGGSERQKGKQKEKCNPFQLHQLTFPTSLLRSRTVLERNSRCAMSRTGGVCVRLTLCFSSRTQHPPQIWRRCSIHVKCFLKSRKEHGGSTSICNINTLSSRSGCES